MHPRTTRATAPGVRHASFLAVAFLIGLALAPAAHAQFPNPPQPPGNPPTEAKRLLGKVLFFDEQLSAGNTVACATCHVNSRAGADPRLARNPGPDGIVNSPDDRLASPGVIRANSANDYFRDAVFALNPQITGRAANSPINAAFSPSLFWDGRATPQFIDPQNGQVALVGGGALESQSVAPPVSSAEMAHDGMGWGELTVKLARVRPLDLATNLPPDLSAALQNRPTYAALFQQAFGTPDINARRIAFAIAVYERTLIASQTPWDSFQQGQVNALTPAQQAGLNAFQANCAICHTPPLFTNNTFRNIGLRPTQEDLGRQIVTGNPADRGRFKVPGLRGAALKPTFMHNGQFSNLTDVIRFYAQVPGSAPRFPDNIDPAVLGINLPPQAITNIVDFLTNGLRDPRVANQTFPFDRPSLFAERAGAQNANLGGGTPGSGGILPRIIASDPPMIGNPAFRIGLDQALGGAVAQLGVSTSPPVGGGITPERFAGAVAASGGGPGQGLATLHWPLTPDQAQPEQDLYVQWIISDPGAPGGEARSAVVRLHAFCGSSGCPASCGYANCDESAAMPALNIADFACFLNRFAAGDPWANCDGSTVPPLLTVADFSCFLNTFAAGCP